MAIIMLKSGAERIIISQRKIPLPVLEKRGVRTTMDSSEFSQVKIIFLCLAEELPKTPKKGLDPEKAGRGVNSWTRSYAPEFFILQFFLRCYFFLVSPEKRPQRHAEFGRNSCQTCIPLSFLHAATTTYQLALLNSSHGNRDKGS
jgi:hypothetical protein